jgi:hypothetical protein
MELEQRSDANGGIADEVDPSGTEVSHLSLVPTEANGCWRSVAEDGSAIHGQSVDPVQGIPWHWTAHPVTAPGADRSVARGTAAGLSACFSTLPVRWLHG